MDSDNWQKQRKQAAWRRRRIIFNNDGGDAIGHVQDRAGGLEKGPRSHAEPGSPQWFWAQRCTGLEDTQVDSIFYYTGSAFSAHSYDAKVTEVFDSYIDEIWGSSSYIKQMIDRGRDCLGLIIDFARRNGKEVFWTLRMNDIHDNWTPAQMSQFKKAHPELLLFRPEDIGKGRIGYMEPHMNATAVDYAPAASRDWVFAIIEEVGHRYDIDGIELDFMRNPIFFRPTLEGRPVERGHLEIMTEFIRRIRGMTEEVGQQRGKPLLIAVRVPCRVRSCLEIGLDIERWLKEDLVDMVVSSIEFEPLTGPLGEMVKLGHQYNVPVYADASPMNCGATCRNWDGLQPVGAHYAAATNAWNAGVDGIYTYNLFDIYSPVYKIVGDPALLETLDKVYLVDYAAGHRTMEHVLPPEGRLPVELSLGKNCTLLFPIGDDVAAQAQKGNLDNLHIRIYIDNFTHSDKVECKLNGQALDVQTVQSTEGRSPVVCGTFLLRAKPAPALVKKGSNLFEICLTKRYESAPGRPTLVALQMPIRYKNRQDQ